MTKIAVFDFDGTIYTKDSLIEFCKFMYKKQPLRIRYLFIQFFALLAYKLRIINTTQFKQHFLIYLKGISQEQLMNHVKDFWKSETLYFNTDVIRLIVSIQKENIELVGITASPDFMFAALSKELGFSKWISTKTLYHANKYKIVGKNCRAAEKLIRLEQEYINGFVLEYAVSDNHDDNILLQSAGKSFKITHGKLQAL